jgi:type I restriction enzyme S subunit
VRSTDPKRNPDDEFWYVDISAVDNVTKRISTPQKVSGKQASVRARQLIASGDILVATTRPNLNSVAMVPDEYDGQICSTGFCVLRAGPELDPGYLFSFVQSRTFVDPLVELTKGALYPAVTDRQVFAQNIPWVDVTQQRRIANHLATQLAAVEEARQAATAQLRELTHLANAIIRETLTHPGTETHFLGDVLHEVKQGIGTRWADFPVLGATRDGLAPAKEPVGKHPERYKPVQVGTVFYNPMRILIGSIAMVDEGDAPGVTSPDYVALRGREGVVDSRWFYYWLRSPEGERCISSLARGAVRERMLFNRLAEGEIVLPPYPIQQAASRALAELRPMKQSIEARLREIERLPQRLLAEVFDMEEDVQDA